MSAVNELSVKEAKAMLSDRDNILVLDKRDLESYKQGHIEGAMMAHDGLIESLIKKGDKKIPILVYCYKGNSSMELAALFSQFGFKEVYNMTGGYTEWKCLNESH